MLTQSPLVQELELDIALSKANGRPTKDQLRKEFTDLEQDQELVHEEVELLLGKLEE